MQNGSSATFAKNGNILTVNYKKEKTKSDKKDKDKLIKIEEEDDINDIFKSSKEKTEYIISEYEILEERMGKRLKKQFTKYYQNKDIIFQGYQKCLKLIKFEERYTLNEKLDKLEKYINEYEEEIKNNKKEEKWF